MKIYTTTMDDFKSFERFFKGHDFQLLPKEYKGLQFDLLLFPGGSDVHPKRYSGKVPKSSIFGGWINEERDEWEFKVIQDYQLGKMRVSKVLGICRGMQFLNVAMGGTLLYDIASRYGNPHPYFHDINWQIKTVFSSITTVNSDHHQAIYTIGSNLRPKILCLEPSTNLIESAMWGANLLGMQFHPEWVSDESIREVFSKGILDWIKGKDIILEPVEEDSSPRVRKSSWITAEVPKYYGTKTKPDLEEKEEKVLKSFMQSAWDEIPSVDDMEENDNESEEEDLEDDDE